MNQKRVTENRTGENAGQSTAKAKSLGARGSYNSSASTYAEQVYAVLPLAPDHAITTKEIVERLGLPWNPSTKARTERALYRLTDAGRAHEVGDTPAMALWCRQAPDREGREASLAAEKVRQDILETIHRGGRWDARGLWQHHLSATPWPVVAAAVRELVEEGRLHWAGDWLALGPGGRARSGKRVADRREATA